MIGKIITENLSVYEWILENCGVVFFSVDANQKWVAKKLKYRDYIFYKNLNDERSFERTRGIKRKFYQYRRRPL